jgi:hypothetical protein
MYKSFNLLSLISLENSDVITQQISDHHPVIHQDSLFWNIMMPGRARRDRKTNEIMGFNNGFGIEETESQYIHRLKKIALVISEIVFRNPTIQCIGLCEGPIEAADQEILFKSIHKFPFMRKFGTQTVDHTNGPNWGLILFYDQSQFHTATPLVPEHKIEKLTNRFELWSLKGRDSEKTVGLSHLPFSGDEEKSSWELLSSDGKIYADLVSRTLKNYQETSFVLMGDLVKSSICCKFYFAFS